LNPAAKSVLMNTGGTVLNIFWLLFFGWWLCLMHIASGIAQCVMVPISSGLLPFWSLYLIHCTVCFVAALSASRSPSVSPIAQFTV
ncbi:hypothetical protein MJM95_28895, partial [Salmonella enterica subsp. enterica serovar Anatum]|nr:hypothetical protein [Salmonella enterica subsp. enterica serovar Anatum]